MVEDLTINCEKDLLRIMSTNECLSSPNGTGFPRLRRILRGNEWFSPNIGHCHWTDTISASLFLLIKEESVSYVQNTWNLHLLNNLLIFSSKLLDLTTNSSSTPDIAIVVCNHTDESDKYIQIVIQRKHRYFVDSFFYL